METAHKFLKRRKTSTSYKHCHSCQAEEPTSQHLRDFKAEKTLPLRGMAQKGIPTFPDLSLQTGLCPFPTLHCCIVTHRQILNCWTSCPANPHCRARCSPWWGISSLHSLSKESLAGQVPGFLLGQQALLHTSLRLLERSWFTRDVSALHYKSIRTYLAGPFGDVEFSQTTVTQLPQN